MPHWHNKYFKHGLIAVGITMLPLAGCSPAFINGSSAFGSSRLDVPEIPDSGNYTTDRALSEARNHFANNDFGYSAALYKRVVELSPKDPGGYIGLGASYDRLRRFDLSDRVYKALYRISGPNVQYYNNLGYSHMLRGDLKTALKNFRKAQKLDPGNVTVFNNLQILANAADARA